MEVHCYAHLTMPTRANGREAAITPNKNRRFCDSHAQKPVSELCEVVSSAKRHRILGCQWSASVQSYGFTAASNAGRQTDNCIPVTNTPCLLGVIAASLPLAPESLVPSNAVKFERSFRRGRKVHCL